MSKLIISQYMRSPAIPEQPPSEPAPVTEQRCIGCHEVKPLAEFSKKDTTTYRTKCKVCRRPAELGYGAKHRAAHREEYNAYARRKQAHYRQNQRDYVASLEQQVEELQRRVS
jgi:tRNA(Ile)-lysidine synthase TilS/MesJ